MTIKTAAPVLLIRLDPPGATFKDHAKEFEALVYSAGYNPICGSERSGHADQKLFFGQGTVDELVRLVKETCVHAVIVAHGLTPVHARNLAKACGLPVLDRTELILEIFAQRALTYEGKLQVELAQLKHPLRVLSVGGLI